MKVIPNPLVDEDGQYTITSVKTSRPTKVGNMPIMAVRVLNKNREEKALLLPVFPSVTDQSNLGKLVNAFGQETENWVGKRISVRIDNNRTVIEPMAK